MNNFDSPGPRDDPYFILSNLVLEKKILSISLYKCISISVYVKV